jgi:hypothetical protein
MILSLKSIYTGLSQQNPTPPKLRLFLFKKMIEFGSCYSCDVGSSKGRIFDAMISIFNRQYEIGRAALHKRVVDIEKDLWIEQKIDKK